MDVERASIEAPGGNSGIVGEEAVIEIEVRSWKKCSGVTLVSSVTSRRLMEVKGYFNPCRMREKLDQGEAIADTERMVHISPLEIGRMSRSARIGDGSSIKPWDQELLSKLNGPSSFLGRP